MAISEIEKLERRYQENPQGLTFAPLAEAYRKRGETERALALLQTGLELFPDYIPASIVQGRCYLDVGNDAGAEGSFSHVLTLDPENVIALKALADVAERGARFDDAERWLEQLLSVDRTNEDVTAQLERVRAAKPPVVEVEEGAALPGADDLVAGEVDAVEGLELEAAGAAVEPPPADVAPLSTVERATETARLEDEEPPAPLPPPEPFRFDTVPDDVLGVTQLGGGDDIVLEAAPSTEYQLPSASEDFGKGPLPESASGATEFQLPSAADELDLTPSDAASEYQLPSASDDLALPELNATGSASEYQLPDASSDFHSVPLSGTEGNEFQAPDAASEFQPPVAASAFDAPPGASEPVSPAPPDEPAPPAADAELAEPEDEAPGQWATWADAALDPEAPAFEEEAPAFPDVAPAFADEAGAHAFPGEATATEEATETDEAPADPMEAPDAALAADLMEETVEVVETVEIVETVEVVEVTEALVADVAPDGGIADDLDDASAFGSEPELVVTESMAELFMAQGHPADALRVYQQLLERRPDDERLQQVVARLEVEAAAAEPTPHVAASMSGGTSVREMMRALLGTRPDGVERAAAPVTPASDAPGSPTRPAPDHLTLSAIFGDDTAPLPPVMRPPPARTAADRGVTFDEFYGQPAHGAPVPHERTTRVGQGEDDLDQFHDWLQNLKR